MAVFNEILAGRYNRFLQKLFVLKGPPPTPQLASEIIPTFSLFTGVENRVLETWQRYAVSFSVAAVAANLSKVRIRNNNKAVVAVFEKILLANANAATALLTVRIAGAITTDLANSSPLANVQLDLRGPQASNLLASNQATDATVQSGIAVYVANVPANGISDVILTENQELVLANGNVGGAALNITNEVANQSLNCSVIWRERTLEESEQSFG